MTRGLLALLTIIITANAFPAMADERVQVALVAERGALVTGTTQHVGVTFTMKREWHIYWLNPGDSGLPTEVEVTSATTGVTVGAPLFPAPTRYEHAGNLVDFIYEGEVTVLVPVTVSKDVPVGTTISLAAKASWLVCKEACFPGSARVSLKLPVAKAPGEATEHAPRFERTRARLATNMPADVKVSWDALALQVVAPEGTRLLLFPLLPEEAPPVGSGKAGATAQLTYPNNALGTVVKVLLELHRGDKTSFHWIEIAAPSGGD